MEQPKLSQWTTKMGFITGPLIMIMGILVYNSGRDGMGKFFIGFGIFRTLLTAFMYYKTRKHFSQQQQLPTNEIEASKEDISS